MPPLFVAAIIAAITLLGMFVFPGHTWLQADTQIYVPMLEQIWDPSLYSKELITSQPHLAFTIYDETALVLRLLTRLDFHRVLLFEQTLFRSLAVWGIYLIGRRFNASPAIALVIAGIVSLGATISGPSVLSFEYEPVPRGFAVSLLLLAIGLAVQGSMGWSSVAASVALLFHAPTTIPFWLVFAVATWGGRVVPSRRFLNCLIAPLAAMLLLLVLSRFQGGGQPFFTWIDPEWERLQRFRASYNWVSLWPVGFYWHYAIVWLVSLAALWRLRMANIFLLGLPILGMISVPLSYLLLERLRWSLIAQVQPARWVLLVTVCAVILACLAAVQAVDRRRWMEAFLWLLLPFVIPIHRMLFDRPWPVQQVALILGLAAFTTFAMFFPRFAPALVAAVFLIPFAGKVSNYATALHTPALADLAAWARTSTPKDAVFVFPLMSRELTPGIFRAESLRAVYVDWKAGGQVNYFRDLGIEWWSRWQAVVVRGEIPPEVDFAIYRRNFKSDGPVVYENDGFVVIGKSSRAPTATGALTDLEHRNLGTAESADVFRRTDTARDEQIPVLPFVKARHEAFVHYRNPERIDPRNTSLPAVSVTAQHQVPGPPA